MVPQSQGEWRETGTKVIEAVPVFFLSAPLCTPPRGGFVYLMPIFTGVFNVLKAEEFTPEGGFADPAEDPEWVEQ